MFPFILSVLVCLGAFANSDARLGQIETRAARMRYEVPQEIKNLVPQDFAANNLRKSRLKKEGEGYIPVNRKHVTRAPTDSIVGTTKSLKASKRPSKHAYRKSIRNGPNNRKFIGIKKSSGFHVDGYRDSFSSTKTMKKTTVLPAKVVAQSKGAVSRLRMRASDVSHRKSEDSFASIKKAINALPQQLVTVMRDDSSDCNENPTRRSKDAVRGPPCDLVIGMPGPSKNPWFSMRNSMTRNWRLFYN